MINVVEAVQNCYVKDCRRVFLLMFVLNGKRNMWMKESEAFSRQ